MTRIPTYITQAAIRKMFPDSCLYGRGFISRLPKGRFKSVLALKRLYRHMSSFQQMTFNGSGSLVLCRLVSHREFINYPVKEGFRRLIKRLEARKGR